MLFKNNTQLAKYPGVIVIKPSNKMCLHPDTRAEYSIISRHSSGGMGVREAGVMEESGGVDVMEEEGEEDEDDHDEDDHDDDEDEGGSDMDEDGVDMIGDDSFRIFEEDAIYLPMDEGSG